MRPAEPWCCASARISDRQYNGGMTALLFAATRKPRRAPHWVRVATTLTIVMVSAGAPTVSVAQPAATATPPAWAARLDSTARAALTASRTPGATVAVVQDGRIVYVQGYGIANVESQQPMTPNMLLRVGSVTKMFTGLMLAELAEKKQIDMQAPVSTYVTALAGKKVGAVTTHQLMTHNAGWLDNAVAYGRMGEGALGEVMREVSDTLFFTEPGRTFSYSNPSISMAGYVGEVAGKQRFASLVESLVLRPTGMKLSTFKPLEALTWPIAMGHVASSPTSPMTVVRPMTENTAQWGAGFLFSTAPELARFAMAMMNGGQLDGVQLLSAGAVRRATTGYVPHPGGSGLDSAMYGYGLVVGTMRSNGQPVRIWTHGGAINGYTSSVTMLPERKIAVIVLVNGPGAPISTIERTALELAVGAPLVPRAMGVARTATAAERAMYVGRYAMNRIVVDIIEKDGQLMFQQGTITAPLQVATDGQLTLALPNGGTQRFFTRVENGRVAYLYQGSRALARQTQ